MKIERLAAAAIISAAALLSGCGKENNDIGVDSSGTGEYEEAVQGVRRSEPISIKGFPYNDDGETPVIYDDEGEWTVLYSFGGVTVCGGELYFTDRGAEFPFWVKSEKEGMHLCSGWISADGIGSEENISKYIYDTESFSMSSVVLGDQSSVNQVTMRLYLTDENFEYVEGSLSDEIVIAYSDKKKLNGTQLLTPIYNDDRVRLDFAEYRYGEADDGRADIILLAENKTDKDIYITDYDMETVHEDFYASFGEHIPAGGSRYVCMDISTLNGTLRDWDLESFSFKLRLYDSEYVIKEYSGSLWYVPSEGSELLPEGEKRIEFTIPEELRPEKTDISSNNNISTDALRQQLLAENEDAKLLEAEYITPGVSIDGAWDPDLILYENEYVLIEYAFAVQYDSRAEVYFKAFNKLDKQIRINFTGECNGYMTYLYPEEVRENSSDLICLDFYDDDLKGKELEWLDVIMEIRYDDGHYGDESQICVLPMLGLTYVEERYTPDIPDGVRLLYEDDTAAIYSLETEYDGESAQTQILTVNRSENEIAVDISDSELSQAAEDIVVYDLFWGSYLLPKTCGYDTISFYAYGSDGAEVTREVLQGYKAAFDITCTIKMTDGSEKYETKTTELLELEF